jgi:hypothetical protein
MGILLDGFTLFTLADCLLTINGNHTPLFSVVMVLLCMFRTPFGHCVSSRSMFVGFSPCRGFILWYWHQQNSLWGAIMPRSMFYVTWGLHFHWQSYKLVRLLGKSRGLCLCVFLVDYCPMSNFCSSTSFPPYLLLNCHTIL